MCICCDCFVTDTMSSSESGLSDTVDPMAIVSDDEIVPEPEIFTSDTESNLEMMSDDDDDFQPFALPDFGDDVPHADGLPDEDPFLIPIPDQYHLILGHPVQGNVRLASSLAMFHPCQQLFPSYLSIHLLLIWFPPTPEPLIWFPPNTMPVSDPYHPSHFIGYTRDELLLSL
ncbi:hypothetical protein HanRHA438_Chr00c34g0855701 [Helianthus annuus]|nr:hypothetical protein HanRHA438_Chr00c34g0855701 [Helianthus annuus]